MTTKSATQAKAFNQVAIALDVFFLQVVKQAATLVDQAQQSAARMVIVLVRLEMVGQVLNSRRQQCDLHLRRAGIVLGALEFFYDFALRFCIDRDGSFSMNRAPWFCWKLRLVRGVPSKPVAPGFK